MIGIILLTIGIIVLLVAYKMGGFAALQNDIKQAGDIAKKELAAVKDKLPKK